MRVPEVLTEIDGERPSDKLRPLLKAVYAEVQSNPTSDRRLYAALEALLVFLASPEGRTHPNCVAADSFFMHNDRWERDWGHVSEPLADIMGYLGQALHDTIGAPEVAENFENTPEQLLDRLRRAKNHLPPV